MPYLDYLIITKLTDHGLEQVVERLFGENRVVVKIITLFFWLELMRPKAIDQFVEKDQIFKFSLGF